MAYEPRSSIQVLNSDRILLKAHSGGVPLLWLAHALIQAYIKDPSIVDEHLQKVGFSKLTSDEKNQLRHRRAA